MRTVWMYNGTSSYPPDKHQSSNTVYWREGDVITYWRDSQSNCKVTTDWFQYNAHLNHHHCLTTRTRCRDAECVSSAVGVLSSDQHTSDLHQCPGTTTTPSGEHHFPTQTSYNLHTILCCIACTQDTDVAYWNSCCGVVCMSVCACVGHGWTDQDAIWRADSCESKETYIRWNPDPRGKGHFWSETRASPLQYTYAWVHSGKCTGLPSRCDGWVHSPH